MAQYPNDADGAVLRLLETRGVDLSRPLKIEFMAHAPDEVAAHNISSDLQRQGFRASVEFDQGEPDEDGKIDPSDPGFGPSWTVVLIQVMIPDYNALIDMQRTIDDAARKHRGNADGWGVLTHPDEGEGTE